MSNYNFVSLHLKCPECGKSLMDHQQLVDNESSIKLVIETSNDKGIIRLSSIYGSHNYTCDIKIPEDEIAKFYCPSCKSNITSDLDCKTCEAPMIPFILDMGGNVSICSRSGCKNHFVEFEDLSTALKKLYQEHSYHGKTYPKEELNVRSKKEDKSVDEKKEIIESGTFLQAYCPHCKKSLIENDMLKLKIINGETGYLMLSPYLNVFSSKSTIYLPEDKALDNIKCVHCDTSLIAKDKDCDNCESKIAKIIVSANTKLLDFYICTKKGCRWHGLSNEDLNDIRLEDSMEW